MVFQAAMFTIAEYKHSVDYSQLSYYLYIVTIISI